MFKKLLKYDVKSIWRIWWILAVSILGLSFVGALFLRLILSNLESEAVALISFFGGVFLVISIFAIFASIILTELLIFYRFYKHLFTDEGYLTFTLPVSRRDILLSKMLNALIWQTAHILLLLVCVCIFLLISPPTEDPGVLFNKVVFDEIGEWICDGFREVGAWMLIFILEGIVLAVGATAFATSLIYFCITVGAVVAKKHKLLAAIGIYYLVNMGVNFVVQILGVLGLSAITQGLSYILKDAAHWTQMLATALGLLALCCIVACGAFIMMFMTVGKLERKLNLS